MKKLLLIFSISVLVSIILLLLSGIYIGQFFWGSFPGFIIIGTGTAWSIIANKTRFKPWMPISAIWLGVSLPCLILYFTSSSLTPILIPLLTTWYIGILVGFIYTVLKPIALRVILIIAALIGVFWCSIPGYRWYMQTFANSCSVNGEIKEYILNPIYFQNQNKEDIYISQFKGKYVVLYFWDTSCESCAGEFPALQKLYDKVKDRDDILVYSVHVKNDSKKETYRTGYDIVNGIGYSFSFLSMGTGYSFSELRIERVPVTLIINEKSNIIYRGDLESAVNKLDIEIN